MRLPRASFTIGRLMVVVLAASLLLWGAVVAWPRSRGPGVAEQVAEAGYKRAILDRELSELGVVEFKEGVDPNTIAEIRGTAALAMSDLERAADRLKWSERMHSKGFVSNGTRIADDLTLQKAAFEVDQARAQVEALAKSAIRKSSAASDAVLKARAEERAKLEAYRAARAGRSWLLGF